MFENLFLMFFFFFLVHGDFRKDVEIVYGGDRAQISQDGSQLHLSLDQGSGSGFQSKNEFLFGKFDMQMKLVPGDSAGTVATCYLSSQGDTRNEIDFEFLGNLSGEPYILHTNIYIDGKDGREQQFYLWFDPREDFHTYSIIWNPHQILYSVDGTPVRVFKNVQGKGLPYPKDQPMRLYATIWNSTWATRGGLVQVDWNRAPFTASYRGYGVDACIWANGKTSCPSKKSNWLNQVLDSDGEKKLKLLQEKYMVYNYCTDTQRFHGVMPPECFAAS